MHVISRKRLAEFWAIHNQAEGPLGTWHSTVERATWGCFSDVRQTYNSADTVEKFVVFNVNSYRVVAQIRYLDHKVYIRHVFTHGEYDVWTQKQRSGKR